MDLEKAFDVMDRGGVLELLKEYGIGGAMFNYIQDFLTDRTFKVKVGNSMSDLYVQENGTPKAQYSLRLYFKLQSIKPPNTLKKKKN